MEKKQTAVEYLVEQLESIGFSINDLADYYNEVQIALEMEKEQNEYFFNCGRQYQLTGKEHSPKFTTKLTEVKMSDISKCNPPGTICPHREKCYRFTAPADEYAQAYFTEPPIKADGTCDMFWGKTQTDILTQLKEIVKGNS